MKKSRIAALLVALPFALVRLAAGCSAQGEGQLCSKLNGNEDCQPGLTCTDSNVCCSPGSTNPSCLGTTVDTDGGATTTTGGGGGMGGGGGSATSSTTSTTSTSSSTSSTATTSSTSSTSSGTGGGDAGI